MGILSSEVGIAGSCIAIGRSSTEGVDSYSMRSSVMGFSGKYSVGTADPFEAGSAR